MNITVPATKDGEAAELTGIQFRDAMSRVAASVHVVTTDGAAGRFGMTASAVASVSDMPPTILVCVNVKTPVNAAIKENGVFCVNALTAHDEAVADGFAGRGGFDDMDARFALAKWIGSRTGAPMLKNGLVSLDCQVSEITETATHSVIFGSVVAVRTGGDHPALLYYNRGYRSV